MRLRHDRTLITGKPGVSKTTLIRKVVDRMGSLPMAGFYTAEIRSGGSRLGFELQALSGIRRTLAGNKGLSDLQFDPSSSASGNEIFVRYLGV